MGHGYGHDNGHEAGHAHRSGPLGWIRDTFTHSHDIHQKVDDALEGNERGIWALKISLVGLGATALLQSVIVYFSGSIGLLADTIHNFGDAATSLPLWMAFVLQRRKPNRRFPYGYGRAEDLAGVIIVAVILFSAGVAGYESIRKLIDPEPVRHLGWVAAAAVIGFLGNEAVALLRIHVGKEIGSAALIADGYHSRVDGFTSLAVLVGAIGVAVGVPVLDPIVGLLITVAILFIVKDAARSIFSRLLDGIEPAVLDDMTHATRHVPGVQEVHNVRARWLGHKIQADLHITVDRRLSVEESHRIVEDVERAIAEHVPAIGRASVHVCPCAHPEPAREAELAPT
jgi:cation diffusion facilitator family transporter